MKIKKLNITSEMKEQFINITTLVNDFVSESSVKEGLCVVYVPHTTAGVTINEAADPDVAHDILNGLGKIVPGNNVYKHLEGNSAAHIKTTIVGTSSSIPIHNGKPVLGTWQGIFFCEFDGPRHRQLILQILGNSK